MRLKSAASDALWDTSARQAFYDYCEARDQGQAARRRLLATQAALMAALGQPQGPMNVADIGCGAGAACRLWAERGHQVFGVDISAGLISLARKRARAAGLEVSFELASATALPWPDRSMDLCIVPQLLEHVADWRCCIAESARVLRPGGALYLSTSNRLCPLQDEFTLPLYAWYPGFVKRRCEELARTTRPQLANHATYPAVNWFTFYGLRAHLARLGWTSIDRFDPGAAGPRGPLGRAAAGLVRNVAPLRFCAQVASPRTELLAFKPTGQAW